MADKLIVKDLGKPLDGEYEFELVDIITVGRPGSLTNREAHTIKLICGLRAGELVDGIIYSDQGFLVALATVLLTRAGKSVTDRALDKLWDAQTGCMEWDIAMLKAKNEDDEGEEDPPGTPAELPGNSPSGGTSSAPTSETNPNDQSPTGPPDSETSATSVQLTSVA